MLVKVEQSDIDEGVQTSCTRCPIARAVHRMFPEALSVRVTWSSVTIYFEKEKWEQHLLPLSAVDFIYKFDNRQPVKPFEFVTGRSDHVRQQ